MSLATVLLQAEHAEAPNPLLPEPVELIVGAVTFIIVFALLARYAFPQINGMLEARTRKIQGDLERAEQARREAEQELARYRAQLADARGEANRIIEEARRQAEELRRSLQAKAEQEAQQIVARAQEEIRAERDRVFQELKGQVAEIAVDLAGRVVGQVLDAQAHRRLIDEYIEQVAASGDGARRGERAGG
ncbi:MAG TPA: F0F1 ATP synthase subunit B [Actinomycetota bacterium]|nr:F0F1 ATP synthase subunit B [Actinomycetota bacterium]